MLNLLTREGLKKGAAPEKETQVPAISLTLSNLTGLEKETPCDIFQLKDTNLYINQVDIIATPENQTYIHSLIHSFGKKSQINTLQISPLRKSNWMIHIMLRSFQHFKTIAPLF
jgi:hypothetical protein